MHCRCLKSIHWCSRRDISGCGGGNLRLRQGLEPQGRGGSVKLRFPRSLGALLNSKPQPNKSLLFVQTVEDTYPCIYSLDFSHHVLSSSCCCQRGHRCSPIACAHQVRVSHDFSTSFRIIVSLCNRSFSASSRYLMGTWNGVGSLFGFRQLGFCANHTMAVAASSVSQSSFSPLQVLDHTLLFNLLSTVRR